MRLIIFWDFYDFSRKFCFRATKLIKKAQKSIESSWTDDFNQVTYYVFWKVLKNFEKNSRKALFDEKLVFSSKTGFLPFFLIFGLLFGQMHRNMQNNCYINGKLYLRAKSMPFLKYAFFACLELFSVSFIVSYWHCFLFTWIRLIYNFDLEGWRGWSFF